MSKKAFFEITEDDVKKIDKEQQFDEVILNATDDDLKQTEDLIKSAISNLSSTKVHLNLNIEEPDASKGISVILHQLFSSISKKTQYLGIQSNTIYTNSVPGLIEKCAETKAFAIKNGFNPNTLNFCGITTFGILSGISEGMKHPTMQNLNTINIDYCSVLLEEIYDLSKNLYNTQIKTFNLSKVELYTSEKVFAQAAKRVFEVDDKGNSTVESRLELTGETLTFREFNKEHYLTLNNSIANLFSIKSIENISVINLDIKNSPTNYFTQEDVIEIDIDLFNQLNNSLDKITKSNKIKFNSITIGAASLASQDENLSQQDGFIYSPLNMLPYIICRSIQKNNIQINQINISPRFFIKLFDKNLTEDYTDELIHNQNNAIKRDKDTLDSLNKYSHVKNTGLIMTSSDYSSYQAIKILEDNFSKLSRLDLNVNKSIDACHQILTKINSSTIQDSSLELSIKDIHSVEDKDIKFRNEVLNLILQSKKISTLTLSTNKDILNLIFNINQEKEIQETHNHIMTNLKKLTIYDCSKIDKDDITPDEQKTQIEQSNKIIRSLIKFTNLEKVQFIERANTEYLFSMSYFIKKAIESNPTELGCKDLNPDITDGKCNVDLDFGLYPEYAIDIHSKQYKLVFANNKSIDLSFCSSEDPLA